MKIVTKKIDLTKVTFKSYINGMQAVTMLEQRIVKHTCSDSLPTGKATYILADGSRVHSSKLDTMCWVDGDIHSTTRK